MTALNFLVASMPAPDESRCNPILLPNNPEEIAPIAPDNALISYFTDPESEPSLPPDEVIPF